MNYNKKIKRFCAAWCLALLTAACTCGCGDKKQVESEQAYRQQGLALLDQGDYEGAVDAFNKALQERDGNVSNHE